MTDQADIFSDGQEQYLEAQLEALEELHKAEIAVLTVSSLEGEDIAQVGYQVASTRGIGKDESANGMLLLIAPNERERGIDVGYGLEGDVPDITAFQLGRTYLVPAFREQKYFDGVSSLVTALSGTVAGTYNPELYSTGNDVSTFDNFLMGFIILLFLGFFVGTFTRSAIDAEHASMA